MSVPENTFGCEVQLLSWSNTSAKGAVIVLQLADEEDLDKFRHMTLQKGRGKKAVAGQRLMAGFSEIGDDEKPQRATAAPLARLAAMWCKDWQFWEWVEEEHTEGWRAFCGTYADKEQIARQVIISKCGILSRAELDHDEQAARIFHDLFRVPYSQWIQSR